MNEQQILEGLANITNPYTNNKFDIQKDIVKLEVIDDKVVVELLNSNDENSNKLINRTVVKYLKVDLGFKYVKISFTEAKKAEVVKETHTKITAKFVAVVSGKGGVGKSKVTALLAKSYIEKGYKVGIIDCDIYGYSIPKILDVYGEPDVVGGKIIPLKSKEGIEVISTQYFIANNENQPIIWRASLLDSMMNHFFNDVKFSDDLDYIFIDMPPGTGDIHLNLSKYVSNVDCLVVTTAQEDAAYVAVRAGMMANDINLNIRGVIENMSYYNHNGEKLHIFGDKGGQQVAQELNTQILATLEITNDEQKLILALKNINL